MRYIPPWGTTDPQAPYVNGDPTIGRQGSIPPAAMMEHPQREIIAVIEKSGLFPSENDLLQLAQGVRSQRLNYAEDTGSPNNLVAAFDPPFAPVTNPYTRGLTLRVRVRHTNTDICRINAGANSVPIRKMNGADVGPSELPAGSIATLVFDGTVFQLSNFGGGTSTEGDTIVVNVPYTVDLSTTPGMIVAEFLPPISEPLRAGDLLAVQVANTATGPTQMQINNLPLYNLAPNAGGPMLQGDIIAGDVVQFFYDGNALRFVPNPEINAFVTYTIGPVGQQFPSVAAAMDILKRKTIGANGYVDLVMSVGLFDGPININHPSADRIRLRGTMIGAAPIWNEFSAVNSSEQQRAQDAIWNINLLRTRYGTEIRLRDDRDGSQGGGYGLQNSGPGAVTFADLLITGQQFAPIGPFWWQIGVNTPPGCRTNCYNVSVWGAQVAWNQVGAVTATSCFAIASTHVGFHTGGGPLMCNLCAAIGGTTWGWYTTFGALSTTDCQSRMNGHYGFDSNNGAGSALWWTHSLGNGTWDLLASIGGSIFVVQPADFGTTSPPVNEVGNLGSIIAIATGDRPPFP